MYAEFIVPLLCLPVLTLAQNPEGKYFDRKPYLQSLTEQSVLVISQSREPCRAIIRFGATPELGGAVEEMEAGHNHRFHLPGLTARTRYFYQVEHVGQNIFPLAQFATFPRSSDETPVLLGVVGDSGYGEDSALYDVAALIESYRPSGILHTGDVVYPIGVPGLYQLYFFDVYATVLSSASIFPVVGNHDCAWSVDYWKEIFVPSEHAFSDGLNFSFDAGSAHLVGLNSCAEGFSAEQMAWVRQDLARTRQPWKILFFHHPPYSNAGAGGYPAIRRQLVALSREHQLDLVLSGHAHAYERFYPLADSRIRDGYQDPEYLNPEGTVHIVSGGGGAALYDKNPAGADLFWSAKFVSEHHALMLSITPSALEVQALNTRGQLLDYCVIRKNNEPKPSVTFIRGDANQNGQVGIADAIAILTFLFLGDRETCYPASNCDNTGGVDIADAVYLLHFLFLGQGFLSAPFPECGGEPAALDYGCIRQCP